MSFNGALKNALCTCRPSTEVPKCLMSEYIVSSVEEV